MPVAPLAIDWSRTLTVFIDPQLGRIGLTEREARKKGLSIRVAKLLMSHVARAVEVAEPRGFVKAVVDTATGQILGCAVLGIEGGEVMSMLQIAMIGGLPTSDSGTTCSLIRRSRKG